MEDEDSGHSSAVPQKDESERFNIRAPHPGADTTANGYRDPSDQEKVPYEKKKVKDVWDLMIGITPDKLANVLIEGAGDALVVGWTESANAVNRAVKNALSGSSKEEPPPPPPKKGASR